MSALALVLASASFLFSVLLHEQIQNERARATLRGCTEVNARHDATIRELDARLAGLPAGQRAAAWRSREFTVALVDRLVPKRDCNQLVQRTVPSK